jgi:hypothetical protein
MGIKKLSQVRHRNKSVGFIGTVGGEVVEIKTGTTKNGQPYANGKVLFEGSEHPTSFSIFNNKNNEGLVDQFVAMCEENAHVVFTAVVNQEPYESQDKKKKIATKVNILSLPDAEKAANVKDTTSFSFMGNHREEGTVYDTMADGRSYLIFKMDVTRSWFDKNSNEQVEKTDNYELVAYGEDADKLAMEHADTPDGTMVQGKARVDGNRIYIKSLLVAPPASDEESGDGIPF